VALATEQAEDNEGSGGADASLGKVFSVFATKTCGDPRSWRVRWSAVMLFDEVTTMNEGVKRKKDEDTSSTHFSPRKTASSVQWRGIERCMERVVQFSFRFLFETITLAPPLLVSYKSSKPPLKVCLPSKRDKIAWADSTHQTSFANNPPNTTTHPQRQNGTCI
jgi:hypothetical protein